MRIEPLTIVVLLAGCGVPPDLGERVQAIQTQRDLDTQRARLFSDFAGRLRARGVVPAQQNNCAIWSGLASTQRTAFLTLTHRLFLAQYPSAQGFAPLLADMTSLYAVRGESNGDCGGGEDNRLFLGMDETARAMLELARTQRDRDDPFIRDFGDLDVYDSPDKRRWRRSRDLLGPHDPFTASVESNLGGPRAQVHYFKNPAAAVSLAGRGPELVGVDPASVIEIDQDYNFIHDSNAECGKNLEKYTRRYAEPSGLGLSWAPTCNPGGGGGGGPECPQIQQCSQPADCFPLGLGDCVNGCCSGI